MGLTGRILHPVYLNYYSKTYFLKRAVNRELKKNILLEVGTLFPLI